MGKEQVYLELLKYIFILLILVIIAFIIYLILSNNKVDRKFDKISIKSKKKK